MVDFAGWPTSLYDFREEDLGNSFAGLIVRDVDARPRAGIFPSHHTLGTAGTGWDVMIKPFVVVRRKDNTRVVIGGIDEVQAVTIPGAPNANSRIDIVWARAIDVGAGDAFETLGVSVGNPGASPVKPAIPAGAEEVIQVLSKAGNASVAQATITQTFPYTCAAGGTLIVRTTAERNAFNAATGQRVYCLADQLEYIRRNAGWERAVPAAPAVPKVARGEITFVKPGTTNKTMPITYSGFTAPPTVLLVSMTGIGAATTLNYWVSGSPTKDGANISLNKGSDTDHRIGWVAIGV